MGSSGIIADLMAEDAAEKSQYSSAAATTDTNAVTDAEPIVKNAVFGNVKSIAELMAEEAIEKSESTTAVAPSLGNVKMGISDLVITGGGSDTMEATNTMDIIPTNDEIATNNGNKKNVDNINAVVKQKSPAPSPTGADISVASGTYSMAFDDIDGDDDGNTDGEEVVVVTKKIIKKKIC